MNSIYYIRCWIVAYSFWFRRFFCLKFHYNICSIDDGVRCASRSFATRRRTDWTNGNATEFSWRDVCWVRRELSIHMDNYCPLGKCCEFILDGVPVHWLPCANALKILHRPQNLRWFVCLSFTSAIRAHYYKEKIFWALFFSRSHTVFCKLASVRTVQWCSHGWKASVIV